MTPSQLRAFHLVAESGSFSAAARDSGLSQPNLSGQVTALEKAYGLRLFDRRGRSVVPTETAASSRASPAGCSPRRRRRRRCSRANRR